jgi:uncharacterized membrane protein
MKTSALFCRMIAALFLVFVFCLSVYRAVVQPITHDEGLIYEWYLDGGVYHILMFDPSNHVLFTFIAKASVKVFGVSELALRGASLLGAAGYLTAACALCRRLFGDGIVMLFSLVMLCLNPQILDFMVAARGYILGVACLLTAIYFLTRATDRGVLNAEDGEWRWTTTAASVFLALSVISNLAFIFPAASLALSFFVVAFPGVIGFKQSVSSALRNFWRYFIVPGALVGGSILWPFLIQVRRAQFNRSLPRASDALRDSFNSSFLYKWTGDVYAPSLGALPPPIGSWQQKTSDLGVYVLLPLLFCFVLIGLIVVSRFPSESRRNQIARCQVIGGATIACVVLTVMLHIFVNVNYPFARLCLYLVPMFTVSAVLVGREISLRSPRYHLGFAGLLLASAVAFDYGLSLNTKYVRYNAYDIISRELFLAMSNDARSRGLTGVRVGGTWWYEPEVNFYRRRYNAEWMKPYDVKDRSYFWESPNSLAPAEYNYYVFTSANDPYLSGPQVRTIFRDAGIGVTVIAVDR